jgi:hypothetical protein
VVLTLSTQPKQVSCESILEVKVEVMVYLSIQTSTTSEGTLFPTHLGAPLL